MHSTNIKILTGLCILLFLGNACKTIFVPDISKPDKIDPKEVFSKLKENSFDYDNLSIRFSMQISDQDKSDSFRGNIRIKKDSIIWISLRSFNIEGARLVITNDSLKIINRLENNYFLGSTDFFAQNFSLNLDFGLIQAIITNSFYYYPNPAYKNKFHKKLSACEDSVHFCILSNYSFTQNINHINEDGNLVNMNVDNSALLRMLIIPQIFKLSELFLEDRYSASSINVKYKDFLEIENDYFPKKVLVEIINPNVFSNIKLSYDNISVNREDLSFPFSIPGRYKPLINEKNE